MLKQSTVRNRLLRCLGQREFALLSPYLERIELPSDFVLILPNQPIEHVYFIESGICSVVTEKSDGRSIEVGIYGREGMSGATLLLDSDRTPHHHFMQFAGFGYRLAAADFLRIVEQSPTLRNKLLRFIHVFMTQTAQSALVNGSAIIEERLARWLLMCRDRVDTNDLFVTHEFLAMMLGVRRSSVTGAIHILEGIQLVDAKRGHIRILNRPELERVAGASYGLPEAEYRRLLGPL